MLDDRTAFAARRAWLEARRPEQEPAARCRSLNEAQQTQFIHLYHTLKFGRDFFTAHQVSAARAALLAQTLRNGSVTRMVTSYRHSLEHIGYGNTVRDQSVDEASCRRVRATACTRTRRRQDGGLGRAGGKGIVHKPKDKKGLYNPKRQAVRDFVHDADRMRTKSLKGRSPTA